MAYGVKLLWVCECINAAFYWVQIGKQIVVHYSIYYIDFGEFKINSFFYKGAKKNSYALQLK